MFSSLDWLLEILETNSVSSQSKDSLAYILVKTSFLAPFYVLTFSSSPVLSERCVSTHVPQRCTDDSICPLSQHGGGNRN